MKFGLLLFNGFTYILNTQEQHIWISELALSLNEFACFLKSQDTKAVYLNYHCHLMDSFHLLPEEWRHKDSIFGLVNWHCHLMDSLASWKHKGSIIILMNYHCHLMDLLTYWRHKGSILFVLVNCHCHLMDLLTYWRHKGSIFGLVNYHLSFDEFTHILNTCDSDTRVAYLY